jgi:hypothetical protein
MSEKNSKTPQKATREGIEKTTGRGAKKGTRGGIKGAYKKTAKKEDSQSVGKKSSKKVGSQSSEKYSKNPNFFSRLHNAMLMGFIRLSNPVETPTDNAVIDEAKKNKGLSRVLNTPLVGRVVILLVTVLTVLAILQASLFSSAALKNHKIMIEERAKNVYSLQSVQSIQDTNQYGEIGDTVTTYLGDKGNIANVYPGVRSDRGKYGLGYYYSAGSGLLRPSSFKEVWNGSGLGGTFASILWVLMLILLLGSKRWFKGSKFDVKSRRWLWLLQIINGVLIVIFWVQFITPLVA